MVIEVAAMKVLEQSIEKSSGVQALIKDNSFLPFRTALFSGGWYPEILGVSN
jgi:hypothetical protein